MTIEGQIINGTRDVGGRAASRVQVKDGAFAGQRGVVVKVSHPGSITVRLDAGVELPFGLSELDIKGVRS
jgi:hypothetical protein